MKRHLRCYELSDLCFYIRWAFIAGVVVGLLLSLVWQAAQKTEKKLNKAASVAVYQVQLKPNKYKTPLNKGEQNGKH
jgi:hypothetical protein